MLFIYLLGVLLDTFGNCAQKRTAAVTATLDPVDRWTLRAYAHAIRNEETDLSFVEFGDPKRPYTAPRNETELEEAANYLKGMARREGFEPPTLRFEA